MPEFPGKAEAVPVRPIVVYPSPILTTPCKSVEGVDDDLRQLVADMIETMHAAPGVGLAANQIGDDRRVIVVDLSAGEEEGQSLVLINPEILEVGGHENGEEGCLSFPGLVEFIERPLTIRYRAMDLEWKVVEAEAEGFLARVICHEVDHVNGIVFHDRMSPLKRKFALKKIERLRRQGEWPDWEESQQRA